MSAPVEPQAHRVALVDVSALPVYPLGREERLDAHVFLKWHYRRWMSSRTFRLASWEQQGMIRALYDYAQTESPVGTLPDDDDELAQMLRVDRRRMTELRRSEFGPLHGWVRCLCGAEVRLMHPVVLEQVTDALDRRQMHGLSTKEKARYQRRRRMIAALADLGLGKDVLADEVLMDRMHDWLAENRRGQWRREAYEAVTVHAGRMGWFTGPAGKGGVRGSG